MDALITNLGTTSPDDDVFLTGPRVHLAAAAAMTWSGVTVGDLDADAQLKQLVLDAKVSVALSYTTTDRAAATKGSMGPHKLPRFTYALLPSGADMIDGMVAFCTNGRKVGEGGGAGTGVPVYCDGAAWLVYATDAAVAI